MDKFFVFDETQFSEKLVQALAKNEAVFRNGVAYYKSGGIIQHIPLKEVAVVSKDQNFLTQVAQIQSGIQNTVVATQMLSTGVLLMANVIQTQILSRKLDNVNGNILKISEGISEQNRLFYVEKVSEYLSLIKTFQALLSYGVDVREVEQIANSTLANGLQIKNNAVFLTGNILALVKDKKIKSNEHIMLALEFIQSMMEILPFGMYAEFLIADQLDKKTFADRLIFDSKNTYLNLLGKYKEYLNDINEKLQLSHLNNSDVPYFEDIRKPAKKLLEVKIYDELLEKPASQRIDFYQTSLV